MSDCAQHVLIRSLYLTSHMLECLDRLKPWGHSDFEEEEEMKNISRYFSKTTVKWRLCIVLRLCLVLELHALKD